MATFEYKAITNAGKTISGTIDGNSKDSATEALSAQGIKVIQIELSKGKAKHCTLYKTVIYNGIGWRAFNEITYNSSDTGRKPNNEACDRRPCKGS